MGETQDVPPMVEKILSIDDCWGHSVVSEDAVSEKLPMLIQATVKLTEFRKKINKGMHIMTLQYI